LVLVDLVRLEQLLLLMVEILVMLDYLLKEVLVEDLLP
jgi:hypothetical protein